MKHISGIEQSAAHLIRKRSQWSKGKSGAAETCEWIDKWQTASGGHTTNWMTKWTTDQTNNWVAVCLSKLQRIRMVFFLSKIKGQQNQSESQHNPLAAVFKWWPRTKHWFISAMQWFFLCCSNSSCFWTSWCFALMINGCAQHQWTIDKCVTLTHCPQHFSWCIMSHCNVWQSLMDPGRHALTLCDHFWLTTGTISEPRLWAMSDDGETIKSSGQASKDTQSSLSRLFFPATLKTPMRLLMSSTAFSMLSLHSSCNWLKKIFKGPFSCSVAGKQNSQILGEACCRVWIHDIQNLPSPSIEDCHWTWRFHSLDVRNGKLYMLSLRLEDFFFRWKLSSMPVVWWCLTFYRVCLCISVPWPGVAPLSI